jgi:hypothetical protein
VPYKPSAGNTVGIFGLANGGNSGVAKRSILDRLGTPKGAGGCKVIIENLGENVSENDLKELCEIKGEVTNVLCKFIRQNKLIITIHLSIIFANKCKTKYNKSSFIVPLCCW